MAFGIPLCLLLYYALRGGSYDIVVRQEEALVVWWVVGIGFATGLLPRSRPRRLTWTPFALLILLAALTAISLGWTDSDERTLAELARVLHYLGLLVLVWSAVDGRTWRAAAGGVVAAALAIAVLAVASRLFPSAFPADDLGRVFKISRLNYPFDYFNALAAWAAMSLALGLGWSAHAEGLASRVLALAALPACGLAIYLTYSRGGVVGAAVAIVAVLVLSRNRFVVVVHALAAAAGTALCVVVTRGEPAIAKSMGEGAAGAGSVALALVGGAGLCALVAAGTWFARGDRWRIAPRPAAVALGATLVALVVFGVVAGPSAASKAWDQFRGDESSTGASADPAARLGNLGGLRYALYSSSLKAFRAEPLTGIGAGTFEFWWSRKQERQSFEIDGHSLYLEQLAELGWPGGLLTVGFAVALLALGLLAVRRRPRPDGADQERAAIDAGARCALVAAYIVFLVYAGIDWIWESTAATVLALMAVAVAGAGISRPAALTRLRWRVPVVFLAVVAALVQLPGLVSTSKTRDSEAAFRAKSIDKATTDALEAVDAQPWAAGPHVQAALVFEVRNELDQAAIQLQTAVRREPTNWRHPLLLARVEAERGRPRAAIRAFRKARRLRPFSPFLRAPTPPPGP